MNCYGYHCWIINSVVGHDAWCRICLLYEERHVAALAAWLTPILPYMLAFAAGAMCYVVVEELIPEASSGEHSNLSTIGFAIGFVLMMVLDVVMG
jgi:hypothetical protein